MILINSVLTLPMLGTPQAANIIVAGATNFPMPGGQTDCSAVQAEEPARHDLEHCASGEPSEQQAVSCQLFRSASRFRPSRLGENGLALEPGFIHATCRLVLRRSSAKFANSTETIEMPLFANLSTFIRLAPPCGVAAARAMTTFGIRETMQQKLLNGRALRNAYPIAKTGKAEPYFVRLPRPMHCGTASRRLVPQDF